MENEQMENENTFSQVTLEKLFNEVLEVFKKANSLILLYQDKLKSVFEREQDVAQKENNLKEQISNFSQREQAVAQVENVLALKKQSEAALQDVNDKRAALDVDRKTFEQYKAGESSRLNELRLTTQKESDNVIEARKQIDNEVSKRVNEALSKIGIKISEDNIDRKETAII
jgi:hypothetical protein